LQAATDIVATVKKERFCRPFPFNLRRQVLM